MTESQDLLFGLAVVEGIMGSVQVYAGDMWGWPVIACGGFTMYLSMGA